MRTTLFERATIGLEASWAAAGMLSLGGEIDTDSELLELFLESRHAYRRFIEELSQFSGEAIDYRECGAIDLAYCEEEWSVLLQRQERHTTMGIRSRHLTVDQVQALSPHANAEDLFGALFYPDDGIVAPRDVMNALRTALAIAHVEIRENTPVERVAVEGESVLIHGERFRHVVIAAGAWSGSIEIDGAAPLPASEPVRGHLLGFDLQLGACPTILRRDHTYVFQRGNGQVVGGSSMERVGFDRKIDAEIVRTISGKLAEIVPLLDKMDPVDIWTGFRPSSEHLQLGRHCQTPIFLAYGHYRNGILLAPGTARLLSDQIFAANGREPVAETKRAHG